MVPAGAVPHHGAGRPHFEPAVYRDFTTKETEGIHIDAQSGVSGAGRATGDGFDFVSVNENLRPYAVTGHKHIAEMLTARGGAGTTRVLWRWPNDRYTF